MDLHLPSLTSVHRTKEFILAKNIKINYNNYIVPGNLPLVSDAVMYDTQIRLIVYGIENRLGLRV